jgi:lipopolysaccharide/colanic/teichoic acid biosynthesis glycosyltransferase
LALIVLLPILTPFMLIVALAIRLDGDGPALFKQERIGFRGETFWIYKFRTMSSAAQGPDYTLDQDPRITRIGRVLRKYRIDELPQAINILKGEMSWIGPRPESVELADWYEKEVPFFSYRHVVRPGISGWAQVKQGHSTGVSDVTDKLHYDFYYIKHFSPWLDLLIFFLTIRTILTGFGAR